MARSHAAEINALRSMAPSGERAIPPAGAAVDVATGRLDPTDEPRFVAEMALAICTIPTAGAR